MIKTTEIFSKEVKELTNNEYELRSEYINNKTKVNIYHNKCNNIYEVRPDRFIQGDRCPYCRRVKRYTTETYKEKVKELTNNEYEFIDTYKNNSTKSKYIHHKCNKEFSMLPSNFNSGNRCPYCSHPHSKKTLEQLKNEIYNKVGNEYSLLSDTYTNNKSKIKIKHNKCNNIFETNADNFLNRGRRCPKCAIEIRAEKHSLTHEEFLNKLSKETLENFDILTKYTKRKNKIKVLCKKCNTIFSLTADEFLNGNRCPKCRASKGETKIRNILNNLNISFKEQFSFDDLYYKNKNKPLSFDFKLNISDDKIVLIEYDGEFHEKPVYGVKKLKEQQYRDLLKNNYCHDNNFDLYRINYRDYAILPEILTEILKNY